MPLTQIDITEIRDTSGNPGTFRISPNKRQEGYVPTIKLQYAPDNQTQVDQAFEVDLSFDEVRAIATALQQTVAKQLQNNAAVIAAGAQDYE